MTDNEAIQFLINYLTRNITQDEKEALPDLGPDALAKYLRDKEYASYT